MSIEEKGEIYDSNSNKKSPLLLKHLHSVGKSPKNVAIQFFTFGIFNELLATENVNVARFARNVE